jgi:hypothetical protein
MRQKGSGVSLLKEIEASFLTLLQVLLFVAVDEFAVATKQWLTSVGHCGSPRSRLLLGWWRDQHNGPWLSVLVVRV